MSRLYEFELCVCVKCCSRSVIAAGPKHLIPGSHPELPKKNKKKIRAFMTKVLVLNCVPEKPQPQHLCFWSMKLHILKPMQNFFLLLRLLP